jgi:mannosyltransferase OCH1-like enzyme
MIPKIIWQTYESDFNDLPDDAKKCVQTWKDLNPDWEHKYMNANDRREFVLENFGQEWLDIFDSCPFGVMRSNIWRYMIVYIYGGAYFDIDTICKSPIKNWIKENYDMTICRDDDKINYAQFAFLGVPNHPALKDTLNEIKQRFTNPDFGDPDAVYTLTGEPIWTEAVKRYLGSNNSIYAYDGKDIDMFHTTVIHHLGPRKNWDRKKYIQWTDHV